MAALPPLAVSAAAAAAAAVSGQDADLRKLSTASTSFVDKRLPSLPVPVNGTPGNVPPWAAADTDEHAMDTAFYVPLLRHCIETRSMANAEAVHAHVLKSGVRRTMFVGTSLVDMYMKCGSPAHARQLFDELENKNVVTWTALISGYVRNGQPMSAVAVFLEMLEGGGYPTHYTLGAALSACCALRHRGVGEQVHAYMIKYGVLSLTSMGNSLCSLYAKCDDFEAATAAFDQIEEKNVISWTTMISYCSEKGDASTGLALFFDMLAAGFEPNEFTLTSVLSLCCVKPHLAVGKQVHAFSIKSGSVSNVQVRNSMMYLYLKAAETRAAMRLVEDMEDVSVITWNAMIAGHAQVMTAASARDDAAAFASGLQAMRIFLDMTRSGMRPDIFSFSSILTVCGGMVAAEQGEQMHAQAVKTGCLADVVVGSALLNMYNKCGCVDSAAKVFGEMPAQTLISWTSMLTGYAQHGRAKEALRLFDEMTSAGVQPNEVTFIGVLSACSRAGLVDEARRYFDMMRRKYAMKHLIEHYACMVDMYVRLGRLGDAFTFVEAMDVEPSEIIWSILVAGCRSHGKPELGFRAAERLLALKPRTPETYFQLLNMYVAAERWDDVAAVRRTMRELSIGAVVDRSSVTIRDKVHCFYADDRLHPQADGIYSLLETTIEKAKEHGYAPHGESASGDAGGQHSERLAVAFGLLNNANGGVVRVVKNMAMCRDCHNLVKVWSAMAGRVIVVRDSRRLHRFDGGRCSCGDFAALI